MQRPPIAHLRNAPLELGLGAYGAATDIGSGGGTAVNLLYRTPWDLDVFAQGHAAALSSIFRLSTNGPQPVPSNPWRNIFGGQVGVRNMFRFRPDMIFASEFAMDYLEDHLRTGSVRHLTALARFPVAQQVWGNLWAFVAPTVGLSLPLYESPPLPFFGVTEMPLGLYWELTPTWGLVVEGGGYGGGFWTPEAGGYVALTLLAQSF